MARHRYHIAGLYIASPPMGGGRAEDREACGEKKNPNISQMQNLNQNHFLNSWEHELLSFISTDSQFLSLIMMYNTQTLKSLS